MQFGAKDIPLIELLEHIPFGNEDAYILGFNIDRLIGEQGITVASLAKVSNVSRPVIYRMMSGEANSTLNTISRIAKALGVTSSEILTPPFSNVDHGFYRNRCIVQAQVRKDKALRSKVKNRVKGLGDFTNQ